MKHTSLYRRALFLLHMWGLVLLIAGCGSTPYLGGTQASTPTAAGQISTALFPPTQTSCPPVGMARAAVLASLSRGSDATIIYITNSGTADAPKDSTLERYNVKTNTTTQIVKVSNAFISEAQVSHDGQWILFVVALSGSSGIGEEIQVVRLDGQGLQTLYCASKTQLAEHIYSIQWSLDQKSLIFDFGNISDPYNPPTVSMLDMGSGKLQSELGSPALIYIPRTWLNNTEVLMTNLLLDYGPNPHVKGSAYLLDVSKGARQPDANLQRLMQFPGLCSDVDSSLDGSQVFASQCSGGIGTLGGPSSILVGPATGGPQTNVYSSATLGITTMRVVGQTTLLLLVNNYGDGVDTSHNGLWKITTTGSGLLQLTTDASSTQSLLNASSQYSWSNVSRDGSMYVVKQGSSLFYGSLSGSTPKQFASGATTTPTLDIAGWTTL